MDGNQSFAASDIGAARQHHSARLDAAARALHAWHGDLEWDAAPAAVKAQRRQQALWALRAADATARSLHAAR